MNVKVWNTSPKCLFSHIYIDFFIGSGLYEDHVNVALKAILIIKNPEKVSSFFLFFSANDLLLCWESLLQLHLLRVHEFLPSFAVKSPANIKLLCRGGQSRAGLASLGCLLVHTHTASNPQHN